MIALESLLRKLRHTHQVVWHLADKLQLQQHFSKLMYWHWLVNDFVDAAVSGLLGILILSQRSHRNNSGLHALGHAHCAKPLPDLTRCLESVHEGHAALDEDEAEASWISLGNAFVDQRETFEAALGIQVVFRAIFESKDHEEAVYHFHVHNLIVY